MTGKRLVEIIQEDHLEDYEFYLWVYGCDKLKVVLFDEKNKVATLASWEEQKWETSNGEKVTMRE